jgi:hypothetical protein
MDIAIRAGYLQYVQGRSIIRELGKVVSLPKADIDAIVDEPLADKKHHPMRVTSSAMAR